MHIVTNKYCSLVCSRSCDGVLFSGSPFNFIA